MNNPETSLLKVNTSIERVGKQIAITNKLLQSIDPFLIPYRKRDKWGFCDRNKRIVIECVYDWCDFFYGRYALIKFGEKFNYIDIKNNILSDVHFDRAQRFSEGLAFVKNDNVNGFINIKCEIEIPIEGIYAVNFKDGIAIVYKNGGQYHEKFYKVINRQGEVLYDITPDSSAKVVFYSDGFFLFQEYINKNKRHLGPIYYYESINHNNKLNFDKINSLVKVASEEYERLSSANPFSEGMAAVQFAYDFFMGKEWGWQYKTSDWIYIDYYGNSIPGEFYECGDFSCGLAPVYNGGNWGYINKSGEMVIQEKYTKASNFYNDLAFVYQFDEDRPYKIIDKKGNEILSFKDVLEDFYSSGIVSAWTPKNWLSFEVEIASSDNDYEVKYVHFNFEESLFQYINGEGNICTIDKKGTQYWED